MVKILSTCKRIIVGYWRVFKQPTPRDSIRELFRTRDNQLQNNVPSDPDPEEAATDTPTIDDL
jgi:hypothetical protein